mmetsp:Transcript_1056/g.2071  ORF Transcript_1056/g.2071 Transcript_1056/m.2071 type:complete len:127 (-) Transcript_1056:555-935(-)
MTARMTDKNKTNLRSGRATPMAQSIPEVPQDAVPDTPSVSKAAIQSCPVRQQAMYSGSTTIPVEKNRTQYHPHAIVIQSNRDVAANHEMNTLQNSPFCTTSCGEYAPKRISVLLDGDNQGKVQDTG